MKVAAAVIKISAGVLSSPHRKNYSWGCGERFKKILKSHKAKIESQSAIPIFTHWKNTLAYTDTMLIIIRISIRYRAHLDFAQNRKLDEDQPQPSMKNP